MEVKENILKIKSFTFAIRIVKLYTHQCETKKEYVLSKQCLRSGTCVGAMIREAEYASSKADFIHKMTIAVKEINETIYWLDLMTETKLLDIKLHVSLNQDAEEILKLLIASIKTAKKNLKSQ
jgi:four helix bundle protein